MNYNKQVKSLYELFKDYPKEFINIVLKRFKKEKTSMELLKKRFGPKFDGKDRDFIIFSYADDFKLDIILFRIEELLKFMVILQERENKSLVAIEHIILDKSDTELNAYQKNILNKEKDVSSRLNSLVNKTQLIKMLQTSEEVLSNALMLHENQDERIAFKYYYGIDTGKKDLAEVSNILGVEEAKVQQYVNNVIKEMPKLVKEYKGTRFKEINVKKENSNNNILTTGIFWKYFITDNMAIEEQNLIKEKIKFIIDNKVKKNISSFIELNQILNNDLETKIEFKNLTDKQKYALINCKNTIRQFYIDLSMDELKAKLETRPRVYNKIAKTFLDYFVNNAMSLEEQNLVKEKVQLIIDIKIKRNVASFARLNQILSNGIETEIILKNLTDEEKYILKICKNAIRKYINLSLEQLTKKLETRPRVYNKIAKTFLDYFVNDDMSLEERNLVKEKVQLIIDSKIKKGVASFVKLDQILSNGLETEIILKNLTKEEKDILKICKNSIRKYINLSLEQLTKKLEIRTRVNNKKSRVFVSYFMNENMTLEEQSLVKEKVQLIIDSKLKKGVTSFAQLNQILSNGIETEIIPANLTKEEKHNLKMSNKLIRRYISLSLEEIPQLETRVNRKTKTFLNYFVNDDMSLEEQDLVKNKLNMIIDSKLKKGVASFVKLDQILSNGIETEIVFKNLSKEEKYILKMCISTIKKYIVLSLDELLKKLETRVKVYNKNSKTFLDYFVYDDMSLEEQDLIKQKVQLIIDLKIKRQIKSFIDLKQILTNGLETKISEIKNINVVYSCNRIIKTYLNRDMDELKKEMESNSKRVDRKSKTFISYFVNEDMPEEQKNIIREKVECIMALDNSARFKQINSILINGLDTEIKIKNLSKIEINYLYIVIKKIRQYLLYDKEEIVKEITGKNDSLALIDYFIKKDTPKDEILGLEKKLEQILLDYRDSNKKYAQVIVEKTHGDIHRKIDKMEDDIQKANFYNGINQINKMLKIDIKKKRMLDYLTENELTSQELAELKTKYQIILEYKLFQNVKHYQLINDLTHGNINALINVEKLSKSQKVLLRDGIKSLKGCLNLSLDELKVKFNIKNLLECLTSKELEFLEVQELQQKVYEELTNNQFPGYEIISNLTNKKILTTIKVYELSKEELDLFKKGLVTLTNRLKLNCHVIENNNRAKPFMSYINKNRSEDLDTLRKKVELILETKNNIIIIRLKALLNNGIDSTIDTSKFNKKEKNSFYEGVRHIKQYLNTELSVSQTSKENNLVDKNEIYEECKALKTDLVIYRDVQNGLSIDEIVSVHQYSVDTVLTLLIDNIEKYDVNKLVLDIATNYPAYIAMLLSSNYFAPYLKELTLKEQKLIYLKLLALSNPTITDALIAGILALNVEDVKEYQIMSKYDEVNALNLVLKR